MDIVFVENRSELEFLDFSESSEYMVISLKPYICTLINNSDIKHNNKVNTIDSHSLFSTKEHMQVISISERIIEELRTNFNLFDDQNIDKSYEIAFISQVRFFINYLIAMSLIVDNAVKKYEPKKIISVKPDNISSLGFIKPSSSFIGEVIKNYCRDKNIEHQFLNLSLKDYRNNSRNRGSKKKQNYPLRFLHKTKYFLNNLLKLFLFELQIILFKIIGHNKKIIFSVSSAYNLDRLTQEFSTYFENSLIVYGSKPTNMSFRELFSKKVFFFFKLPSNRIFSNELEKFKNYYQSLYLKLSNQISSNKDIFFVNETYIGKIIDDYIKVPLRQNMMELESLNQNLSKIFLRHKPDFAFAQHALGMGCALSIQSNTKNIKAMLVTHGTFVPSEEYYSHTEWSEMARNLFNSNFPFVAVQTPNAKKFLSQQKNVSSLQIKTGALIYSRNNHSNTKSKELKNSLFGEHANKIIILHASTPKNWGNFSPYVYETLEEYILNMKDLVSAAERIKDVHIALRVREKDLAGLSIEELKIILGKSDSYSIYPTGSFEEYLFSSDALVSYSSTCIEEALINEKPVIQYDPYRNYKHLPALEVSQALQFPQPIYFCGQRRELKRSLDWIVTNHLKRQDSLDIDWSQYRYINNNSWIKRFINAV